MHDLFGSPGTDPFPGSLAIDTPHLNGSSPGHSSSHLISSNRGNSALGGERHCSNPQRYAIIPIHSRETIPPDTLKHILDSARVPIEMLEDAQTLRTGLLRA